MVEAQVATTIGIETIQFADCHGTETNRGFLPSV